MAPMRKAVADGRVFATTYGSEPWRVLALPGWMHTVADFDGVLEPLAADGVGSVAVDLPGFGGVHPEPPAVWGAREYADWLAPALDDLAAGGPLVLAGHSRGGAVALELAVTRPDKVAGLVLVGVPLVRRNDRGPAKAPLPFRAGRWLHKRGLLADARMERLRRQYGSADYRNASGVMRDILVKVTNETYEDELRRVQCPVELVWGAGDDAAPVNVAEQAKALLGDRATLTVLPDTGHLVPTARPDDLRAALTRAIERADRANRP